MALALVLALCALASRHPTPSTPPTTRVRIEQGDTLWAIADRYAAPDLSTAQMADLIAELNNLNSAGLAAGSELDVPTATESENDRLASR